jgi:hypothetical protein
MAGTNRDARKGRADVTLALHAWAGKRRLENAELLLCGNIR